jgi:hypothetical protein
MITFDVPNLDDQDADDLAELETTFNRLAAYSGYMAIAKRLRAKGDIECALSYEKCADRQYRLLPAWAKW